MTNLDTILNRALLRLDDDEDEQPPQPPICTEACPFCAAHAHLGACDELISYVDQVRAGMHERLSALSIAVGLADKLARVTHEAAHVVNDEGHPLLASASDLGIYWTQDQVVYTALPTVHAPLDVDYAAYGH